MKRALVLVPVLLLAAACEREAVSEAATANDPVALATPAPAGPVAAGDADGHDADAANDASLTVLRFDCRGQETAWRLRLGADGRGRLREDAGTTELAGELKQTGSGHAWRAAPLDAPGESFAALLTPLACFPPEGGNAKPYTAALSWPDGRREDGCCSAVRGLDVHHAPDFHAPEDSADWSAWIPRRLAGIEHCALDAGVDVRAVVHVREGAAGRLVVRLRDSDGGRYDCLLDPAGGDIEAVTAVAAADVLRGEGRSEWLPADPDRAPALQCGHVFATRDGDGELRGWLHRRDGC
ncbi:hypothetical protein [Arenimonas composti]|uniref:Lipoprotein n=1 Tax=Arenimonas composti TR7-09 = DSM 18010 TaxID=1121013 RepID=A0A091BI19_9GAMM|nr:hypothetical protein [Arenimonas composti]KFN51396.1 hypothetical protein P873_03765 [Arenimonas composti TR7-09 = DSM 18010]